VLGLELRGAVGGEGLLLERRVLGLGDRLELELELRLGDRRRRARGGREGLGRRGRSGAVAAALGAAGGALGRCRGALLRRAIVYRPRQT